MFIFFWVALLLLLPNFLFLAGAEAHSVHYQVENKGIREWGQVLYIDISIVLLKVVFLLG